MKLVEFEVNRNRELLNIMIIEAVSYTHLDVYKRQDTGDIRIMRLTLPEKTMEREER